MNIHPTAGLASLAGTPGAQAHRADADRRSAASGAATDPQLQAAAGIEESGEWKDRDADGRQMLDRQDGERRPADADDEDQHKEPSGEQAFSPSLGATDTNKPAEHIDFEA